MCSIESCNKDIFCKGLCKNHYMISYRNNPKNKEKEKQRWIISFNKDPQKYYDMRKKQRSTKEYKDNYNNKRKEKYNNDFKFKTSCILRSAMRRAVNYQNKKGSYLKYLGCTVEEFRQYIESKFKEGMTWDNWSKDGWHIDHIKPISKFDLSNEDQIKEACHYTNLQPLWAKENLIKSNKEIICR